MRGQNISLNSQDVARLRGHLEAATQALDRSVIGIRMDFLWLWIGPIWAMFAHVSHGTSSSSGLKRISVGNAGMRGTSRAFEKASVPEIADLIAAGG